MIVGDVVARIFDHVDFHQISRFFQQLGTLGTEVTKMQSLVGIQVTFGERIDGFDCGVVIDS